MQMAFIAAHRPEPQTLFLTEGFDVLKLQLSGSGSRVFSARSLYGACAIIAAFGSLSAPAPALAGRHFHSHWHHSATSHAQRVQVSAAHQAKVAVQDQALRSGSIVAAATAFQGTRYVFGGTSRSGFDCSGFTRYILGQSAGVALPRTAMEQYLHGTSVSPDQLQVGDLVFFKNTYRRGISHVGIYIGDGHFVHACNETKGVTVSALSEAYYVNHYAGARRVIASRATDDLTR